MDTEQVGCGISLREAMPLGKETPLEVIQKIGETGYSGGISDVTFYPTFKCNLDCYMCLVKHMKDFENPKLSTDQVKDAFKDAKTLFHLGGEPFIYDNTMDLMKHFDSKGINQIISTNGTHITPAIAEQLAAMENLVVVQVSLNGSGENDNIIRGSSNAFNRTVESIKNLKNAGVLVWIHCVILNENIDDLANVVKLGVDLGVDAVNFIFAHVITQEEIQATQKLVKSWLGEDVEVGGHVGELNYSEEQLINSVNAAKQVGKENNIQVLFFSRLFGEQPELYYRGTLLEQENPICQLTLMPPLTPEVGPDGEVYNCPYLVKSFGNVKDKPLEEIWDSEQMRALRKGMINGKLMPICRRCPCSDKIETSKNDPQKQEQINKESWEAYLEKLYKALNGLPEVPPILEKLEYAPVVFQHHITDHPELNYWHAFEKDGIRWGMGENNDENVTKLIHKTDLETLKNINSGDENPVQATMAGKYSVDGDMTILMSCAPLLPLTVKAHAIAIK
jgi:MoaA/NifB/PqqE/SkfB family radical SAM enzyme